MTQPALSRLEASGVIPTIPLLERITTALDADLIVEIAPHAARPSTPPTSPGGHDAGIASHFGALEARDLVKRTGSRPPSIRIGRFA
jgi:hypothetical protein